MGLGSLENHVKKANQSTPAFSIQRRYLKLFDRVVLSSSFCSSVRCAASMVLDIFAFGVLPAWCLKFLCFLHLTADTLHACQSCRKLFVLCEKARAKRAFRRLFLCSYILRFNDSEQQTSIELIPIECKIFMVNNRDCLLMVIMWTHQHIMGIGQGKGQVIVQCEYSSNFANQATTTSWHDLSARKS